MKWPKALRTPTAIREEHPDAHNMTPLERASGYGNTAGTTMLRGVDLKWGRPAQYNSIISTETPIFQRNMGESHEYRTNQL
jgi:hypothetical protein